MDAKGLECPIPLLKTVTEIRNIEVGEILEILSTDQGSISDITRWAKKMGHKIIKVIEEEQTIKIYIRRG
ncbi:MAG: hypothetical protein GTO23_02005 [Nitrososphaeria archaeon]|nr:hypothetical protein [Nitrososphaeria archaeon]